VYALIRLRGYQGSERTVERRLKGWRDENAKERFFEQEYEPGEQAQFDFKELVELPFCSGLRVVHLHFGTLPFSGTCAIKGYGQKNYECFMDGIHAFFEKIGGMTQNIRIDNLSPCVKNVRKSGGRDYTEAFKRAQAYYDFGVLPCSPGRGNEKGDVERDIRTWARRFKNHVKVQGLVFRDFSHLNEVLSQFVDQEIGEKEKFSLEQPCLRPLLPREPSVLCKIEHTRASAYGTVRLAKIKATYSVPDSWIGLECEIVAGPFELSVRRLGSTDLIVHPRMAEGENSILLEHVLKSLLRKPQAMVRWAHREILFPEPIFKQFYQCLQSHDAPTVGYAEREFLRTLNLVHHVALSEIRTALEIVLPLGGRDIFTQVRELLLIERRPAAIIDLEQIRPNLNQYDELIPVAQ
jgi:hypothetical protein